MLVMLARMGQTEYFLPEIETESETGSAELGRECCRFRAPLTDRHYWLRSRRNHSVHAVLCRGPNAAGSEEAGLDRDDLLPTPGLEIGVDSRGALRVMNDEAAGALGVGLMLSVAAGYLGVPD
jgi:hypothetical protein